MILYNVLTVLFNSYENFNFDEVKQDLDAHNIKGDIKHVLMKRYSGCKHDAKE
ncbi:hypothetical protein Hanom_Chr00s155292g01823371 [Helianthus anomalus]